jgi:hypothetical protein
VIALWFTRQRLRQRFWLGLLLLMGATGCATPEPPSAATPALAPVASLVATFTPRPTPSPTPLLPPASATAVAVATPAPTAIPFDATVVELRYTIPALGLDRRLQGSVAGRIILVDEVAGQAVQRSNQSGILIQLQQILPQLTLDPAPEGCAACVQLSYELPFDGAARSGWLQDARFLASIDNYLALALGPHFPPGAQVGLRRSASPYAPAHTVALTADGLLWRWLAIDGRIPDPAAAAVVAPGLAGLAAALPLDALADNYVVVCTGGLPLEQLLLQTAVVQRRLNVVCPEFALPTTLLPLYLALDGLLEEALAGLDAPLRPPAAFPLNALLDYRRDLGDADEARLTIYQGGFTAAVQGGTTITTTLAATQVISLTAPLLASDQLSPELASFRLDSPQPDAPAPRVRLLVRGPAGVVDGAWTETAVALLAPLDELLDALLSQSTP